MAFLNRADMYSNWGDLKAEKAETGAKRVSSEWKGVYPNPKSAKERYAFELALIRREASNAQKRSVWVNYDFKTLSDGKTKIVSGSNLNPEQIMDMHYKVNLAAGINKFGGSTRDQARDDMQLAKMIGMEFPEDAVEATERSLSPLEVAKQAYQDANAKIAYSDITSYLNQPDDSAEKLAKAKELHKQLDEVSRSLQKIVDLAAGIDPVVAGVKRVSGQGELGLGLITDRAAHTAAKNLLEYVDELDKIADKLEKNQLTKKDFRKNSGQYAINVKKYSRKGTGFKEEKKLRNLENLSKTISGSMSNLMGGMFELAIEQALKTELADIFSSVSALGAGGSTGIGRDFRNQKFTSVKSKRDIGGTIAQYNDVLDISIGFSAKNQYSESTKKSETKLLDTNTGFVRKVIAMSKAHDQLLEIAFANSSMWATNSQMNRSIAALMADVAVAGLGRDRVDYIVYRDAIYSIEEFYKKKSGDFKFTGYKDSEIAGNAAQQSASNIINNGTTKIIFKA